MMTSHALLRAAQRGISSEAIQAVLSFGSRQHHRGAVHYSLGRREVEHGATFGVNLKDFEHYHVVCSSSGFVITVYRQHRPHHRRPRTLRLASRQRVCGKVGSDALLQLLNDHSH